jgi:hypothetical protein
MTYTPNIPQAAQTIAFTQAPLQANCNFLQTAIGEEHNFNVADATQTYHLQASMPNLADPSSFPVGAGSVNGMYYVSGGVPKFYDGTNTYFIQINTISSQAQIVVTGSVTLSSSSNHTVFTVPIFSAGTYYIIPPSGIGAQDASAIGQFVSSTTVVQQFAATDPGMSVNFSGLVLKAQLSSSSFNGTYKYVITYTTP